VTACIEAPGRDARYPRVRIGGRIVYRHRLAYEEAKGPIPEGLTVDHLCFNTRCVNPDHLEAVPNKENVRRGWQNHREAHPPSAVEPGVSRCLYGHKPDWWVGIKRRPSGVEQKIAKCRECHRGQMHRRRAALLSQPRG